MLRPRCQFRRRALLLAGAAFVIGILDPPSPSPAADGASPSDLGGVGLLQTRNARFHEDGTLDVGYSRVYPHTNYYVNFQFLPWLESTFRYVGIDNDQGGSETRYDRNIDLKVRLLQESDYLPQLALGLQDIGGTGIFSSEYIVASKRFGPLDFSLGLGWGRLAGENGFANPLGHVAGRFKVRANASSREGGTARFEEWFTGDIGLFGGVEYHTPIDGLSLKLEYSPDAYVRERADPKFDKRTPVNAGLNYHFFRWFNLGLGWERGTDLMFRVSLTTNPTKDSVFGTAFHSTPVAMKQRPWAPLEPPNRVIVREVRSEQEKRVSNTSFQGVVPLAEAGNPGGSARTRGHLRAGLRPRAQFIPAASTVQKNRKVTPADREAVARKLFPALKNAGFNGYALELDETSIIVHVDQGPHREAAKNIGRIVRTVGNHAPDSVEVMTIVQRSRGIETGRVTLMRRDMEKAANYQGSPEEVWRTTQVEPATGWVGSGAVYNPNKFPSFNWSIEPKIRQAIMDPNEPYRYQVYLALGASTELAPGWFLSGSYGKNLADTFEDMRTSDSALPHVRSDVGRYLSEGKDALLNLQLDRLQVLGPDLFGRVSVGNFEEMFGGVGGEILYRPRGERWAVGAELYRVRQRDYSAPFSYLDYEVTTGHASLYYDIPYYGLLAQVHAGRYLAGDYGVTFDLSRRFDNGFVIGAFATFTDVPAATFGEGSFDKGFYMAVPLEVLWGGDRARTGYYEVRPLTRDGGQRLYMNSRLYWTTEGGRQIRYQESWEKLDD